jgi:hypothetical protein
MSTTFNIRIRDRILDLEGGLQVNWEPELQELRTFAYHGFYFAPGWTEQDIQDYASTNALDGIYAAISSFFPEQYTKGSLI